MTRPKRESTHRGGANVTEAQRLDGRQCAAALDVKTAARASALRAAGVQPHLAVVIVGDDPASHVYVRSKVKACERLGLKSTHVERPSTTTQEELQAIVDDLNADASVHGILVQSPLPRTSTKAPSPIASTRSRTSTAFIRSTLAASCRAGPTDCCPARLLASWRCCGGPTSRLRAGAPWFWAEVGLSGCRWRFFWRRVALTPP